jgi:hypothetical protein
MVMKFDPQGHVAMLFGRKAANVPVPARPAGGAGRGGEGCGGEGRGGKGRGAAREPGAGQPTDLFDRPTDVAWDAAGNIFVADGLGNARVAKFDKNGKFVKSWGKKGTPPASSPMFAASRLTRKVMYPADGGNKRIQVFDNNGVFKTAFTNVGNAQALCMTKGANQALYVSNSNPPNVIDRDGEIYKMRLDGTITGEVWQGPQDAEGIRHCQRHRLHHRQHALRWRDRQSESAEAGTALAPRKIFGAVRLPGAPRRHRGHLDFPAVVRALKNR